MGHNLLDFHFNLFGIDRTITSSNTNDSVAFQSFTISWNLNMGYKTKVITLTPKRSTIASSDEKEMIISTEIRNSNNTCFFRLKKYFCENLCFWVEDAFLQSLKIKFVKKPKFYSKAIHLVRSSIQNFRAIYPQIT